MCRIDRACRLSLLLLSACAAQGAEVTAQRSALYRGDPSAAPAFAALPDITKAQQSTRVAQALSLVQHTLSGQLPTPPDDRRYEALQTWIDETVAPWISARRDSVDELRFQFDLAHNAVVSEQVIARGVIGLLQENTAQELSQIPLPSELDTEPEIADIFRDLVNTQAKPFRNAALAEYRQCDALAEPVNPDVQRWSEFCHVRAERLRADRGNDAQLNAKHP